MAELDMARLRALAAELGYWPATADDEHIAELRRQNAHYGAIVAQDPEGTKWQKMLGNGKNLSAVDSALRQRLTELCVHIPCGGIRGPFKHYQYAYPPEPFSWQSCPDEDSPETWEGCDVSRKFDLCIICVRATAGGMSRWAHLACEDCRSVNTALEKAWGFRPFALGRHSLMNGIGVRGGSSPEVREKQMAQLVAFKEHVQGLSEWKKREYSRLAADFDPLGDIPLCAWQERWVPGRKASVDAFTRLTGVDLPDAI